MKKIIILISGLFIGSLAMSQNTSDITQNGDLQEASADQTGNLNNATISQTTVGTPTNSPAYMNKATVVQDGNSNEAIISQEDLGGAFKGEHDASITQEGNGNISNQSTYAAPTNNNNYEQNIEALQIGDNNSITQSINGGQLDEFYAEQRGILNSALQEGTEIRNNTASLYQDGVRRILNGETSVDEVLRVTQDK